MKEATENGAAAEVSEKMQMTKVDDGMEPEGTENGAATGESLKEQMNKVEDGLDPEPTENGAATGEFSKEQMNKVEDGADPEATENGAAIEESVKEQINKVENGVDPEAAGTGEATEESVKEQMIKVEVEVDPKATEKSKDLADAKETPKKRKRSRKITKKAQTLSDPESSEKERGQTGFAGLIFMCSAETKKDCFKYGVFGFPIERKDVVEHVKKGMELFLFDIDRRLLYGIYKACSEGGIDLEPMAFKESKRKFPAQVRFRIHKECFPIEEADFKQAIKENYSHGKKWFNCQLDAEQVGKLMELFRPLDAEGLPKAKSKPAKFARDSTREPRKHALGDTHIQSQQYVSQVTSPLSRRYPGGHQSSYSREHLDTQLHRQPSYARLSHVTLAEAEAIYQQKLQEAHWDALTRAFASDPTGAHVPRRYMDELSGEQLDNMPGLHNPFFGCLEGQRGIRHSSYGGVHLSGGAPY